MWLRLCSHICPGLRLLLFSFGSPVQFIQSQISWIRIHFKTLQNKLWNFSHLFLSNQIKRLSVWLGIDCFCQLQEIYQTTEIVEGEVGIRGGDKLLGGESRNVFFEMWIEIEIGLIRFTEFWHKRTQYN